VQVLWEFFINGASKLPTRIARSAPREAVNAYAASIRQPTTADTVLCATDIAEPTQISFWRALIVAAAE
jgi:predicted nucleic acid-binding protein